MNVPYDTPRDSQREQDNPGPKDLQRETDAIRNDLGRTLSELERKFSPRELLDRSLEYVHENGGDLLQKIGATVNKNPLPLLVTSAGLIWLLASSRSSASPRRHRSRAQALPSDDGDAMTRATEAIQSKAQGVKRRASQSLDAARSRAVDTWSATREHAQEYSDTIQSFVREQPLACGAMAIAAGAVLGAAFPATTYERDLVARARGAVGTLDEGKVEAEDENVPSTAIESNPSSLSH